MNCNGLYICTCTVDCGTPPGIENGSPNFTSTVVGAVATYRCDDGYRLATPRNQMICLESGAWSNETIQCEAGNYHQV